MKNSISKIGARIVTLATSASMALAAPRSASEWLSGIEGTSGTLENWITTMLNWAIGIAALLSVVMLVFSGYLYITANGDENKVEKATKTLTFAIVGLVVCFIAIMLVQFVLSNFLNA